MSAALQRLTKWRVLFTGWQLGTRPKGDPEGDAVRDHREVTILLRAECSALVGLLIQKGVFTAQEWQTALDAEAEQLSKDYERRFPGIKATDIGLSMAPAIAADTMRGWKP
jgi:hypothetical protein